MPRDIQLIVDDMLGMIEYIENTVAGKSRAEAMSDQTIELALQRAIEIISEASRHIPSELLTEFPDIPWPSIRTIGNILRHEYHRIVDEVIWDVIVEDLPALKAALQRLRLIAPGQ